MGLKYILCSCLDSHAVFQAPCWDWCNCRSLGGHSHARFCEALALEKTLLPIAAPGLYCWLNLTASRQTCPPQWMAAHHCSSSSGCFSGWKICGARIPATQNTEWMGPPALFLFTSVRWAASCVFWEGWSWCVWLVCSIAEPGIWKAEKCILFLHERFMISFFIALLCPQAAWFFFFPWGKNSLSSLFFFTN